MPERALGHTKQKRRVWVDLNSPSQKSSESLEDQKRALHEALVLQETSEQYKEWVLFADRVIEAEMRRLNVEPEILEGRDAFFSEAEAVSPSKKELGFYDPLLDVTIFRSDTITRELGDRRIMKQLHVFHERIHHHSFLRVDLLHSEADATAIKGRFALAVHSRMNTSDPVNYFTPILEAVTEGMAMDLMLQQCDADPELKQLAGSDDVFSDRVNLASEVYTPGSGIEEKDFYITYTQIMNLIYKNLSEIQGELVSDVKDRWRRSLFTGEMMHMRDIERVFGPGSLRFLGALGFGFQEGMPVADQVKAVGDYFLTQDHDIHEQIARQFLKEDELQRWLVVNQKNDY